MSTKNADMPHVVVPQGAPPPEKAKHGKEGEYTPPLTDEERKKKEKEEADKAAGK